jgi:superfamily II DNA or RNA helicase
MTLRDQKQREFADVWLNKGRFGILNLCPRFGKIRTSINVLREYHNPKVLIAYPDNKIKDSWINDFNELNYDYSNVTFTTHLSIKKYTHEIYDVVIIDEIHLLSKAQTIACKNLLSFNRVVLGLTGTLSKSSKEYLKRALNLKVLAEYSIDQAISDKVITDYEIRVITVPLDNKILRDYKGKMKTEKERFDNFSYVIKDLEENKKDTKFLKLARKSLIQSSLSKLAKTKSLIKYLDKQRVLIFCGTTAIADSLGIPSFHSKSKDKSVFTEFCEGKGNKLAVVKIGNTGVTYKPLNCIILNDFDSNSENLTQKLNRCMAFEYDNPEKKAIIYIISSDEEVELNWLNRALAFFDKNKIKYL